MGDRGGLEAGGPAEVEELADQGGVSAGLLDFSADLATELFEGASRQLAVGVQRGEASCGRADAGLLESIPIGVLAHVVVDEVQEGAEDEGAEALRRWAVLEGLEVDIDHRATVAAGEHRFVLPGQELRDQILAALFAHFGVAGSQEDPQRLIETLDELRREVRSRAVQGAVKSRRREQWRFLKIVLRLIFDDDKSDRGFLQEVSWWCLSESKRRRVAKEPPL